MPSGPARSRRDRFKLTRAERRNLRTGLLFISPWLVGFFAFTLYPALASLYYSFTDFKILQSPHWIGLNNYAELFRDPLFWKSLGNTLYLTLIGVPLAVVVALSIALLLNRKGMRGIGFFRTIFYLPVVIPAVAGADPLDLPAQPVERARQPDPRRGRDPGTGLVLRSGLGQERDRPPHGLGGRRRRDHLSRRAAGRVAGPVRSRRGRRRRGLGEAPPRDDPDDQPGDPVQPDRGRIGAFQYFTQAYVIGNGVARGTNDVSIGGVQNSLLMYGLNLYNNGFRYFRMGYASALAWLLLDHDPDRDDRAAAGVEEPRLLRERAVSAVADAAVDGARSQRRRWSDRLSRDRPDGRRSSSSRRST